MVAYKTLKLNVGINGVEDCVYVPFNSSVGIECMITQYLNTIGCRTYHLCHGLHFSSNYRFFSIDAYNKELITATTVLSWGQGFVDNDNKLYNHTYHHVVVGNPKYPYKRINIAFNTDTCVVLLARGQYDIGNEMLLRLLGGYRHSTTKFYVKPHPTDNLKNIVSLCEEYGFVLIEKNKTITELLSSGDFGFAISYETTAYFEAMYYNLICFRYTYNENESYGNFDDRFLTVDDLSKQIQRISAIDLSELSIAVEKCLKYEIGMGINRYSAILK